MTAPNQQQTAAPSVSGSAHLAPADAWPDRRCFWKARHRHDAEASSVHALPWLRLIERQCSGILPPIEWRNWEAHYHIQHYEGTRTVDVR